MAIKTYTIKESTNQSVTAYLKESLGLSSRDLQTLFRKQKVKVNGRIAHSKRLLEKGDKLVLQLPQDKSYGLTVEKGPLTILYEDHYTLVVDKPPFMLVHPTGQTTQHTLSNYVAGYYDKKGIVHKIRPVHRLDRDTSGCVLFAKTKDAGQYYDEELKAKKLYRIYLAQVEGSLKSKGEINEPIGVDELQPNRRQVRSDGQQALTLYEVLEAQENSSLLRVKIPTGRTHQIRVHLAYIGHPILGDSMYGKRSVPFTRQCLHAEQLVFTPYKGKEEILITAPPPEHFGQEKPRS